MKTVTNALLSLLVLLVAAPVALPSSDQWNLNPQFYYGAISGTPADLSMFMGVRPDATDDCYDWFDYIKPDPPPGDYVYAYWDRPECDGKKAGDWRAEFVPGECKEWDRLICYASAAGTIWMTWPVYGGSSWEPPAEYTFMLYDVTLGVGPIDMEAVADYHWTQDVGGAAGAHEFRIVAAADNQTPPTITCPANVTVGTDLHACHASGVDIGTATCEDDCFCTVSATRSDGKPLTDPYPLGTTTITWTATDGAGNSASCQQTVTVIDHEPPVIDQCAGDKTLSADESCQAPIPDLTSEVVASDNCDTTPDVTQSPLAGTMVGLGDTVVTLAVADDAGNLTTCTAVVTVADTTAPTIIACASNKTLSANEDGQAAIPDLTSEVVASDNCDTQLTITQSLTAGTLVGVGTHTVTLTVTDDTGNHTTCTATVTVVNQWNLNPQFYYGAIGGTPSDLSMFMGVRAGATDDCYDWFDYIKPDPPPGDYVYAYWDRPECDGKKAGDWRAALAPGECKEWDRLICYAKNAGTIWMTWPVYGGSSWEPPAEYTFMLYDVTLGVGPIDMEAVADYHWTQDVGGPAGAHEFRIVVAAGNCTSLNLKGPCWHMITLPRQPVDPDPWAVFDELRPPTMGIDLLSGNLHRYDHAGQKYVTYWRLSPTEFGPIVPGDGYWLWVFDDVTVCYGASGEAAAITLYFDTTGWYMMGSPHLGDAVVTDCLVYHSGSGPIPWWEAANYWLQDPLIYYSCAGQCYLLCGMYPQADDHYLRAFQGYWLYTFVDDVTLEIPAP